MLNGKMRGIWVISEGNGEMHYMVRVCGGIYFHENWPRHISRYQSQEPAPTEAVSQLKIQYPEKKSS